MLDWADGPTERARESPAGVRPPGPSDRRRPVGQPDPRYRLDGPRPAGAPGGRTTLGTAAAPRRDHRGGREPVRRRQPRRRAEGGVVVGGGGGPSGVAGAGSDRADRALVVRRHVGDGIRLADDDGPGGARLGSGPRYRGGRHAARGPVRGGAWHGATGDPPLGGIRPVRPAGIGVRRRRRADAIAGPAGATTVTGATRCAEVVPARN